MPAVIIENEQQLATILKKVKLKFTNAYFQNFVDERNQKKSSIVIETPFGISRDQIKVIEKVTATRFLKVDVRQSPALNYQTVVEAVFSRA